MWLWTHSGNRHTNSILRSTIRQEWRRPAFWKLASLKFTKVFLQEIYIYILIIQNVTCKRNHMGRIYHNANFQKAGRLHSCLTPARFIIHMCCYICRSSIHNSTYELLRTNYKHKQWDSLRRRDKAGMKASSFLKIGVSRILWNISLKNTYVYYIYNIIKRNTQGLVLNNSYVLLCMEERHI